ncbi:MAG: hypothetical protein U9Q30_05835 [Campylobacterota bacterium]|nr:hypothetical protein [Campylobacterota bacterium]
MTINKFIYTLLFLSITFLLYQHKDNKEIFKQEKRPIVLFENSITYDISNDGVSMVAQIDKAILYSTFQELHNSTLIYKEIDNNNSNSLTAKHIKKIRNNLILSGKVEFQNSKKIFLKTEELEYNIKHKIAKNNTKFELQLNKNYFSGDSIYIDTKIDKIVAKNIHFKINLKEKNDKK